MKKKKENLNWILKIVICTFCISFTFSFGSELFLNQVSLWIGILIVLLFILIGIIFDMIGVAVQSSNEGAIHAMASKKVKGANIAVLLQKNAAKVSSFCNDVIGDICGIISGSAGVSIASSLSHVTNLSLFWITLLITAFIASCTIGGKALGKEIAMKKSNIILYQFSKLISYGYHPNQRKKKRKK